MAGLAATHFSAAGAGGLLHLLGASQGWDVARRSACRMVAFLTPTYVVYLAGLVIFGILLRVGVLRGRADRRHDRASPPPRA